MFLVNTKILPHAILNAYRSSLGGGRFGCRKSRLVLRGEKRIFAGNLNTIKK